jgi:hypothetical protein
MDPDDYPGRHQPHDKSKILTALLVTAAFIFVAASIFH